MRREDWELVFIVLNHNEFDSEPLVLKIEEQPRRSPGTRPRGPEHRRNGGGASSSSRTSHQGAAPSPPVAHGGQTLLRGVPAASAQNPALASLGAPGGWREGSRVGIPPTTLFFSASYGVDHLPCMQTPTQEVSEEQDGGHAPDWTPQVALCRATGDRAKHRSSWVCHRRNTIIAFSLLC